METQYANTTRAAGSTGDNDALPQRRSVDEREFVSALLRGQQGAVSRFQSEIQPEVEGYLKARCWNSRSRRIAREVLDEVFAECFGGYGYLRKPGDITPLLHKYRGRAPLAGWLKRVAKNRMLTRVRSKAEAYRIHLAGDGELESLLEHPGDSSVSRSLPSCRNVDRAELGAVDNPLSQAFGTALDKLARDEPDCLALLELHFLFSVPKNALARAFGVEPSTIGRRITRAVDIVRIETERPIAESGMSRRDRSVPGYDIDDYLEAGCLGKISCRSSALPARLQPLPETAKS